MEQYSISWYIVTWLTFFLMVSVVMVPALLFRKIAASHNKNGMGYMLIGVVVGFLALVIGRSTVQILWSLLWPSLVWGSTYQIYLTVAIVVVSYTVLILAVTLFRRYMARRNG